MLRGSGPEGNFGSELPAADDGWKEGRDYSVCVCVSCFCV